MLAEIKNLLPFRAGPKEIGPVERALRSARELSRMREFTKDEFIERSLRYLSFAKDCGLEGDHIIGSCLDLAFTLSTDPRDVLERQSKIDFWRASRGEALMTERPPRVIEMNLYPSYFASILRRRKTFEGRAFSPASSKNYPDIRLGDTVRFSIYQEINGFEEDCKRLGLTPEMVMVTEVMGVHFAPQVHWMFQFGPCDGEDFQPEISGRSELLKIQSAGVYFTFPDYTERISEFGFLGIEVQNPRLVNKATLNNVIT